MPFRVMLLRLLPFGNSMTMSPFPMANILCPFAILTGFGGICQDRFSPTILLGGPGVQGTNEEVSPDTSRC